MVKLRISRLFQDFSQFMTFEATRCKPHWVVRFVNNFFMNFSLSFCKKFSKRSEKANRKPAVILSDRTEEGGMM